MVADFGRFKRLMALAGVLMGQFAGMGKAEALSMMPAYRSRGHGEGRSNRSPNGANMAAKRASVKARNIKRHRAACKG